MSPSFAPPQVESQPMHGSSFSLISTNPKVFFAQNELFECHREILSDMDIKVTSNICWNIGQYWEGGWINIVTFINLIPLLIYSLKHIINKNKQNTNLSWKPNWVNQQYFLLLQNCYLKIVFSYYYRRGWYFTLFTNNYWKEATAPCFVSYSW